MTTQDLLQIYAKSPQVGALADVMGRKTVKTVFLEGLMCSSAPLVFGALTIKNQTATGKKTTGLQAGTMLFIMQDDDEAGYFYHDLVQLLDDRRVLFFPSSYRRAIKYAQRDAASEILRTEVLARLTTSSTGTSLYIVTYPEAVAELVVAKKQLESRTLTLRQGETIEADDVTAFLRELGFREVDYVYEPGQFAQRGSIIDVYSFSCELPFRIDYFGNDIDSIRTFEVDTQLSKDKCDRIDIVPELDVVSEKTPFLSFLPQDTVMVTRDFLYVRDAIDRSYQEGFSQQAVTERLEGATEVEQHDIMMEMNKDTQLISGPQFVRDASNFRRVEIGHRPTGLPDATITFNTSPQPQFHKNFDLLQESFEQYVADGYRLCILADSAKQLDRLEEIISQMRNEKLEKRNGNKKCMN